MKKTLVLISTMVGMWFIIGVTTADHHGKDYDAKAKFMDADENVVGKAKLTDGPSGLVIRLEIDGLPEGPKAIHIHQVGTCDDPADGFTASGGHVDPENREHGLLHEEGPEAGDLPNFYVHSDGTGWAEMWNPMVSLKGGGDRHGILDADGAALVIHENPDDHKTQPIGGAGARIACGVIKADR